MLKIDYLRENEKIQKIIKKHWIVYFYLLFYFILWITVSITLLRFFSSNIIYLVLVIFWQIFSLFLYIEWLNYELDVFVITDSRIIRLQQVAFLDRTISECNLAQVQEVQASTKWLLSNLLNFWRLTIQTAWNASNFYMQYAPDVIKTARLINNISNDYKEKKGLKDLWSMTN